VSAGPLEWLDSNNVPDDYVADEDLPPDMQITRLISEPDEG
jgi:hypothetical protein